MRYADAGIDVDAERDDSPARYHEHMPSPGDTLGRRQRRAP
jgi:hypothetical protein